MKPPTSPQFKLRKATVADLYKRRGGNDDVRRVKDACDIVRLIGEHIAIKPKGREYVCLCPFHDDHSPSMRIVPAKQIFHCFVCGTGGDVLSFVQKFHKMDFPESLAYLADKYGVTLTPRGSVNPSGDDAADIRLSRRDLLAAAEFTSGFFAALLAHSSHGEAARATIARRGIAANMVERFAMGAAPDRFDGLIKYAQAKGFDLQALHAAGTLKERDTGGYYDLLRHRLVFPIHDRAGRVIAFGGRKLRDEDEPKYINSPETPLFNKSATLYALHLASRAIQTHRTALITEGYTDVIACHQGGFENAVATLGTALTREHASILRTMCDTVILLFDGDQAGQRAADRAVPIFFAEPIDVKIATLGLFTDAKDPDELLKRDNGAEIFKQVLTRSVDLLEYRFARVRDRLRGAGVAALSKAILEEVDQMVQMGLREAEPVRQRLIMKRIAQLGNLDEQTIRSVMPAGRTGLTRVNRDENLNNSALTTQSERDPSINLMSSRLSVGCHMLGCLLCEGSLWAAMGEFEKDLIAPFAQDSRVLTDLAQVVLDLGEDGLFPHLSAVIDVTEDEAVKAAAVALATRIELQTEGDRKRLLDHWHACVLRAKLDHRPDTDAAFDAPFLHEIKPAHPPVSAAAQHSRAADDEPLDVETPPSRLLSAIERIREQQARHATLGADRRKLPRRS